MHGLTIRSSHALGATVCDASGEADLTIAPVVTGHVPEEPPTGRVLFHSPHDWPVTIADQTDVYRMRYAGHLDFTFSRAFDRVECTLANEDERAYAEGITQGAVLSALMTLRGRLSLHATSLDLAGRRIAVFGASGQGKSTTAAKLMAGGATLVSDDVTVLDDDFATGPGLIGLRLRSDAVDISPFIDGVSTEESVDARLVVRQHVQPDRRPEPLKALISPERSTDTTEPYLERLRPDAAIARLLPAARLIGWRDAAILAREFHQIVAVASAVPVYVLHVPVMTGPEDLADFLRLVDVVTDELGNQAS